MKLDILLVNAGDRSSVYQNLGDEFSAIEPPSLAALFATYFNKLGLSVGIIDQPAEGWTIEQTADAIIQQDPVLVAMVVYGFQPSASTQNMTVAEKLAAEVKLLNPRLPILMTGTHPAALPRLTLENPNVDFVVEGEGPRTIASLVTRLRAGGDDFHGISGLWWKADGFALNNPPAKLIDELDCAMPSAAWDLLPMDKYRSHNWHAFANWPDRAPYASIHTTLGCPYKCTFCCINAPFGKSSYRMWSPQTIVQELQTLVEHYGVRNIKFVDEMFVLNRNHVLGVCDEIQARGLGSSLNIWAYARVDTVKPEFLAPLAEAGFRWLALGIESASKHVRDGVEKGRFGSEDIIATVRKVQQAGINVIGNYIFGLPDDDEITMRETLGLALEANCEFANFYSAMAYPGSKLYGMAKEKGWKLPDEWIGYSQHSYETTPLPTDTLTGADVLRFRDGAFQAYYTDPDYLRMVERKFGQEVVEHIGRMVAQPLPRKLLQQ